LDEAARRQLARDIDLASRLQGDFVLRSGKRATEYFDKYRFEGDPALLARVAEAMLELVPGGTEVLAGLELGGVPIATAMSLASGLPTAFVRKAAKTYGTALAVEGPPAEDKLAVIVEDVISTGGAVRDALPLLRDAGVIPVAVVCTIWRGAGAPKIEGVDLPVHALFSTSDFERA
jgi:orotate phosphoribosyltransferase